MNLHAVETKSNSNIVAIIPARLDSARLPGKHLCSIAGKPLLHYLTERLKSINLLTKVILATTEREIDLPLIKWAQVQGIDSFRGSTEDVLGRFLGAARYYNADYIIRANGDSPFLAPEAIYAGLTQIVEEKLDFVTGKSSYTGLPKGLGAEIISFKSLELLSSIANRSDYREHITTFIFDHPNRFYWKPLHVKPVWIAPEISLTVDTMQDLEIIQRIVRSLRSKKKQPQKWTIEEILAAYKSISDDRT